MSCPDCCSGWQSTGKGMVRCECIKAAAEAKRLEAAGIPGRYQARTIESYDGRANRMAASSLVIAKQFAANYPTQPELGLLFTGTVGTGKTHLAVGILLHCREHYGAVVRFVELRELFARMKATFSDGAGDSAQKIMRDLLECDVLAIDEVGAARDTEWQRETTEQLINGRYNAGKATPCTSNLPNRAPGWTAPRPQPVGGGFRAEAMAMSVMRPDTLGDRLGAPMWSRLQEMCKEVEMVGEDQRTTRRKA